MFPEIAWKGPETIHFIWPGRYLVVAGVLCSVVPAEPSVLLLVFVLLKFSSLVGVDTSWAPRQCGVQSLATPPPNLTQGNAIAIRAHQGFGLLVFPCATLERYSLQAHPMQPSCRTPECGRLWVTMNHRGVSFSYSNVSQASRQVQAPLPQTKLFCPSKAHQGKWRHRLSPRMRATLGHHDARQSSGNQGLHAEMPEHQASEPHIQVFTDSRCHLQ